MPDLSQLEPKFAGRLQNFLDTLNKQHASQGITFQPISGFRSNEEQAALYNRLGSQHLAAPPGGSYHNYGGAVDLGVFRNGARLGHDEAAPFLKTAADQSNSYQIYPGYYFNTPDHPHFQAGPPGQLANWRGGTDSSTPGAPTTTPTFVMPANAPAGMRNNNPLNIKYFSGAERTYQGLVGPSQNTDQGDPQMVFRSPEDGWRAAYSLLGRKYANGKLTANDIIAGQGGWTPGNFAAAANVARSAGLRPDEDIRFNDPKRASAFMRGLVVQEQGAAAKAYSNEMIEAAISGRTGGTGGTTPAPAARGGSNTPIASGGYPTMMTPEERAGQSIGQTLGSLANSMSGSGGGAISAASGGPETDSSADHPAIRNEFALNSQGPPTPSATPPSLLPGATSPLGAQLGQLATQPSPVTAPVSADSITAGAPGMTQMLGQIGSKDSGLYVFDPKATKPTPTTAGNLAGQRVF